MFKQKEVNLLYYIEKKDLLFLWLLPLVNIINSLFKFDCLPAFADHITFQLCKSFVGVFLKPTHKGFWNEFIWCVFMDELIRNFSDGLMTASGM